MDDSLWYKDLSDLDVEDLVQLKININNGVLPADTWHRKPSPENPDGVTMDEWIEILENEFHKLGI